MNRFVEWLIYVVMWWRFTRVRDEVLRRYARIYWRTVDGLIKFGLAGTLVFLSLALAFSLDDTCSYWGRCEMRLVAFLDAPANEAGDTLAGLAGALAFLWLIVTVTLQGKELSAQRNELRLTRRESAKMAAALEAQADVFIDEKKQRDETRAKRHLDELLAGLVDQLKTEPNSGATWLRRSRTNKEFRQENFLEVFHHNPLSDRNLDQEIKIQAARPIAFLEEFKLLKQDRLVSGRSQYNWYFAGLSEQVDRIWDLHDRLADDQKERLRNLRLELFSSGLELMLSNEELWIKAEKNLEAAE
ncbi:hypothetical protein RA19_05875 [Leisingera sp. ANG-M1]|uniref:hypothetical protein n=1 Tax=Leisingera sp. ANG-M1 TaxID=1577895 RepID=UPI00057E3A21|nr:hypothetical protein [Leisingera sp. ANG-M1]KIC11566.1 hypothetical protein RA19_05875 [Leisingera sp. ANG-M1]